MWHLDSTVVAQQHNATELPNGNILVSPWTYNRLCLRIKPGSLTLTRAQIFDNGAFRYRESFQYSRAIEIDRATKNIVWQWHASSKVSSATFMENININLSKPR